MEKIRCILHYFRRIAEKSIFVVIFLFLLSKEFYISDHNGVITFRRFLLPEKHFPIWSDSKKDLAELHLTTSKKIEDVPCSLQVMQPIAFTYL